MKKIPELAISSEKVAAILAKARRFDVKDAVTDPDSSSNGRVFTQSSSIDVLRREFALDLHFLPFQLAPRLIDLFRGRARSLPGRCCRFGGAWLIRISHGSLRSLAPQ